MRIEQDYTLPVEDVGGGVVGVTPTVQEFLMGFRATPKYFALSAEDKIVGVQLLDETTGLSRILAHEEFHAGFMSWLRQSDMALGGRAY